MFAPETQVTSLCPRLSFPHPPSIASGLPFCFKSNTHSQEKSEDYIKIEKQLSLYCYINIITILDYLIFPQHVAF